ncbi:MAG: Lecithin:cholesterol acyltransferase [Candidatus Moranbacteria bacterium GW2011_GWA2_39_41]|nr:MAG: Lecithin:cholesterol acyltransferase [Candidatus Moranbacteria bacterium GW2011_GWA2_39_41]
MQKQNKLSRIVVSLLILACTVYVKDAKADQWSPDLVQITQDTTWTKDTPNLVFNTQVSIENGATLTIEKGARIVFQNNPDFPFSAPGIQVLSGKLVANGTREEQVVFTSAEDGYVFSINDNTQASFMRYVTIENAGFIPISAGGGGDFVPHFLAMGIWGGKIHIENSKFINSRFDEMSIADAPIYDADGNYTYDENGNVIENKAQVEVVNSNFSNQNAISSQLSCWIWDEATETDYLDLECTKRVYLKDNWYNHSFGPTTSEDENNGVVKGYNAYGQFFLDSWKGSEEIINPAIVIPGITGSAEVAGTWKMDPILHTYDDLLESLDVNGYTKEKDLFDFPYDWRKSNIVTAQALQSKIDEIVAKSKIYKIDLVAHSMGGLVARQYIESDSYGNNVDKLMTLGTPHNGSPEAYLKWEAGEGFLTTQDEIARHHFDMEALHNNFANTFAYIQSMPSIKELLPNYDYLFDVAKNSMRSYSTGYPKNTFLENLNDGANLEKLKNVHFSNVIGVLSSNQSTISKLRLVNSTVADRWVDGMPENFYDDRTNRGLENNKGDGTVPEYSAENISADRIFKTNSTHSDLPTKAQCMVVEVLMQKESCITVDKVNIPNILLFNIFSPIDIQVVAPDGARVGKDFETGQILNEIEGAYYSGYDTENEFLTIPNPIDGEYKILTQGTGYGNYKIEATKISENQVTQQASESVGVIEGVATTDVQEEKKIEVSGGDVIVASSEVKDTIAPEAKFQFNTTTQKLDITGIDNVSQNVSVVVASQPVVKKSNHHEKEIRKWFDNWKKRSENRLMQNQVATLTDEAGNTTVVVFAKTRDANGRIFATIKSIAYNGVETILNKTSLQYKWQLDRKKKFSQMATHIQTKSTSLESHYLSKKNQTWLMEKPRDLSDDNGDDDSERRPVRTKLDGMIVPSLLTEKGVIKIDY